MLVSFLAIAIELVAKQLKEGRVYAVHNLRLLSTFGNHPAGKVQLAKCIHSQTRENADLLFAFPFHTT